MSRGALLDDETLELDVAQPLKKRLTWGDIPGALELLEPFEPRAPPREPVYDSKEWINSHYPRYGYAARSPLYSWRDWAATALPVDDVAVYLATEQLMADNEQRGGLVKQAQWELARLWDWQQRRVSLGLPPDLPAGAPASSSVQPMQPGGSHVAAEADAPGNSNCTSRSSGDGGVRPAPAAAADEGALPVQGATEAGDATGAASEAGLAQEQAGGLSVEEGSGE
ncbi:hypothetical protein MNEG_0487, partial [Monoraphidium neglectum]